MKTVIKDYRGKTHVRLWVTTYGRWYRDCDVCKGKRFIIVNDMARECSCAARCIRIKPPVIFIEEYQSIGFQVADELFTSVATGTKICIRGDYEKADWIRDNDQYDWESVYLSVEEAQEHFAEDKKKIEAGLASLDISMASEKEAPE